MKLVIEVFLPSTDKGRALAKRARVDYGIYESYEHTQAFLAEKARDARAELEGRTTRKKNFVKPNAIPNRRLMLYGKAEFLGLLKLIGAQIVDPDKHGLSGEIGKNAGGD